MSRITEIMTNRSLRKGSLWSLALLLIGLAVYVILGTSSNSRAALVEQKLQETRAQVQTLAKDNAVLRMKILDLRLGIKETERAAREEHGMIGQGEIVYQFPH